MNNEILNLARKIIFKGYSEFVQHPESAKAINLLEEAIRKENERLNGKNIYCQHGHTKCNWCEDNFMPLNYDYKTAQKMMDIGNS